MNFPTDKLLKNQLNISLKFVKFATNKHQKMPPNAGPSMVAVSPNQQSTMTMNGKGQMDSAQCSLRRSPSAFGGFGFGLQSMAASISSSSKPPLNLHRFAFGANSSSPTEAEMSKENVLPIAVCPAPANQVNIFGGYFQCQKNYKALIKNYKKFR
jgi:hypothetical protein